MLHRLLVLALTVLTFWAAPATAQDEPFYTVPDLNAGLPDPGPRVDRDTPQAAMESFIELTREGFDAEAAHLLNLNDIPVGAQPQAGPLLANQLATILNRKVVISWQALLERDDAMVTTGEGPMVGAAQKSLLIDVMELDYRLVALRLNRIQPEGGDPVWVFSNDSVDNIPALYALYGPSEIEQMLPEALRAEAFWRLQWWEVIGLPLITILSIVIAIITWRGLDAIARNQPSVLVSELIRALRMPATLFILGLTLSFSTSRIFIVSGIVDSITGPLTIIIFVAAAMVLAVNVIDAILNRLTGPQDVEELAAPEHGDKRAQATTIAALRRMAIVAAILIGGGIVLSATPTFSGAGLSILASAGGIALVLGFAAREVLGNIMASMQISLNRSAKVGDQIIYDGHLCTVERIHFTFVQLKVWDDTRLIVPVSKFISDEFINRSTKTYGMTRHAELIFAAQIDVSVLRDHFASWCNEDDRVDGDPDDIGTVVVGQGDSGMHIRFEAPIKDPTVGWSFECDLREEMLRFATQMERDDNRGYLPRMGLADTKTGAGDPG